MLSNPFEGTSTFYNKTSGALLALLLLSGCASFAPSPGAPEWPVGVEQCRELLLAQPGDGDAMTPAAGHRPAAQPYFALDSLHAHFAVDTLDHAAFSEWKAGVVSHSWEELAAHQTRSHGEPMVSSRGCLVQLAQATPQEYWADYAREARDQDLYRDWQRWAGLYPLASPVVTWRIRSAQADWRNEYGGPFDGDGVIYRPTEAHDTTPDHAQIAEWMAAAYADNPLGLPRLGAEQLSVLQALHAPELKVLQGSEADRLGGVTAADGEARFSESSALAYLDHGFARYDDRYLLQLSYTFWFRERPRPHALDIYGGPWNGITWRVTLDESGQPLLFDAIHNCGCYHQVWKPDRHLVRTDIGREEPLFLPLDWTGRPRLTLLPGTHYVRRVVSAERDPEDVVTERQTYAFRPYDDLLALPDEAGEYRAVSLFDDDGLIRDSARLERFVLWPFGVQSPGAMRRNGTHAIAFVGKRQFDDPLLFEQLLEPN
ncbi:MAG: hypothetical protein LAT62_08025 [Natronospirillum sp.]|uniref:hypothetical protein n=1 Tax=Natronospirillum sp. TaxID=2812955 RepID=UPI0025D06E62|nr:hypothetical protein [Natronospirillum sp.]MCH8551868.1 hypothetical protein [Natronospirillum sp.]